MCGARPAILALYPLRWHTLSRERSSESRVHPAELPRVQLLPVLDPLTLLRALAATQQVSLARLHLPAMLPQQQPPNAARQQPSPP